MQADLSNHPHMERYYDESASANFKALDMKIAEALEKNDEVFPHRVGVHRSKHPDGTVITVFKVLGSVFRVVNNGVIASWEQIA